MEIAGFAFLKAQLGSTPDPEFLSALAMAQAANQGLILVGVAPALYALMLFLLVRSSNQAAQDFGGACLDKTPLVNTLFRHLAISESFAVAAFSLHGGASFLTVANDAIRTAKIPSLRAYWQHVEHLHKGYGVKVTSAMATSDGPPHPVGTNAASWT